MGSASNVVVDLKMLPQHEGLWTSLLVNAQSYCIQKCKSVPTDRSHSKDTNQMTCLAFFNQITQAWASEMAKVTCSFFCAIINAIYTNHVPHSWASQFSDIAEARKVQNSPLCAFTKVIGSYVYRVVACNYFLAPPTQTFYSSLFSVMVAITPHYCY